MSEQQTAAFQNTDDADAVLVLAAVRHCASSWGGEARLIGNVRAKDIVRAIDAMQAEIARLQAENDKLRAVIGNSSLDCVYCSLPKADWSRCQLGFPGCDRADDAMLCPHVGESLEADEKLGRLQAELAEASAKLDGALTLGHDCGWNAREILANRREEKLQSELSAAQATIAKMREALMPSAETKAAYIGEFAFRVVTDDVDGYEVEHKYTVPWDTIKEIMKAIAARAALAFPAEKTGGADVAADQN